MRYNATTTILSGLDVKNQNCDYISKSSQTFHYTRCTSVIRQSVKRVVETHLRVITPG